MVTNLKSLLIAVLFLNLVAPVFSFQPSGGVLSLDGVDDYAVLRFEEHGYLFRKNTREFTVEMWFYPKSEPTNHGERNIIFRQQVYFGLTNPAQCKGAVRKLCCYGGAYLDSERGHGVTGFRVRMERNKWNYVAIIYKDGTIGRAYNNWIYKGGSTAPMDRVTAKDLGRLKDFFVGGYDREMVRVIHFHGDIDVIRFSRIARYNLPDIAGVEEPFKPPHRFVRDRDTVALWNFDEREGATRFQDEVKKKRILIGMNGASISSSALAVSPDSTSLTTTWGKIKSRSR